MLVGNSQGEFFAVQFAGGCSFMWVLWDAISAVAADAAMPLGQKRTRCNDHKKNPPEPGKRPCDAAKRTLRRPNRGCSGCQIPKMAFLCVDGP